MKNTLLCLTLALLLCLLPGCGKEKSQSIRGDFQAPITSLDPQFAIDRESKIVLCNTMEGLLTRGEDGALLPGAAQSYTVSPDGLTYTFQLRQDGVWSDGNAAKNIPPTPVTAHDFVFAFRRMFHPQVPSPYCGDFSALLNSQEVLAGTMPQESLGVRATGDDTLVFTLSRPAPLFLYNLAGTGALPCNQVFFEGTRARYGLERQYLLSNGPFTLSRWDKDLVVLERSPSYHHSQEVSCPSVWLYTSRVVTPAQATDQKKAVSPWSLFLGDKADFARAGYQELESLDKTKFASLPFDDGVWTLVLRQSGAFADPDIRCAMTRAIDFNSFGDRVPPQFAPADSFIPATATLSGTPYHTLAGAGTGTVAYAPEEAYRLLNQGLERLGLSKLPRTTLILPQSTQLGALGGFLQKVWQQDLRQFINLELLEEEEYQKRLAAGDFDLALVKLSGGTPADFMAFFASGSSSNATGGSDPELDALLAQALSASDVNRSAALFAQCEERLLAQGVGVPLFTQSNYYAVNKTVTGIRFTPEGIFFRDAVHGR